MADSLFSNPERCRRRNRIAAQREGVEAVPMRLIVGDLEETSEEFAAGAGLPRGKAAIMARIHEMQPAGAEPLAEEDVYIHYLEAANSSFVPDRYVFLHESTLRNVAKDASEGVAFMNSHRTGSMSRPAEVPYGRTFGGNYEADPDGGRTILGVYLLRDHAPNGKEGPSTDDLDAGIRAGTIFDVSVGLRQGKPVCDVCGHAVGDYDYESKKGCRHLPGTHYQMTAEEIAAQEKRGVPEGKCSYSLHEARLSEISAVYDGAVPGAGFRKSLTLMQHGHLSDAERLEAEAAYAALLGQEEDVMNLDEAQVENWLTRVFTKVLGGLRLGKDPERDVPDPAVEPAQELSMPDTQTPAPNPTPAVDLSAIEQRLAELERKNEVLTAKNTSLEAALADQAEAVRLADEKRAASHAESLVDAGVAACKLAPAQREQHLRFAQLDPEAFAQFVADLQPLAGAEPQGAAHTADPECSLSVADEKAIAKLAREGEGTVEDLRKQFAAIREEREARKMVKDGNL